LEIICPGPGVEVRDVQEAEISTGGLFSDKEKLVREESELVFVQGLRDNGSLKMKRLRRHGL